MKARIEPNPLVMLVGPPVLINSTFPLLLLMVTHWPMRQSRLSLFRLAGYRGLDDRIRNPARSAE
jgi:hypothetical protein